MKTNMGMGNRVYGESFATFVTAGSAQLRNGYPAEITTRRASGGRKILNPAWLKVILVVLFSVCLAHSLAAQKAADARASLGGLSVGETVGNADALATSAAAAGNPFGMAVTNATDNAGFRGTDPVPEPNSGAVIGIGFFLLVAQRRLLGCACN